MTFTRHKNGVLDSKSHLYVLLTFLGGFEDHYVIRSGGWFMKSSAQFVVSNRKKPGGLMTI